MNNIKPLYLVIAALLVGGIGFYAGVQFQLTKSTTYGGPMMGNQRNFGQAPGNTNGMMNGQRANGTRGPIAGEIISMDATSITVKLPDGSSKIVVISATTPVSTSADAKITDLKSGDKIGVFGITNTDGSVTAQTIELNPRFGIFK